MVFRIIRHEHHQLLKHRYIEEQAKIWHEARRGEEDIQKEPYAKFLQKFDRISKQNWDMHWAEQQINTLKDRMKTSRTKTLPCQTNISVCDLLELIQ